MKLLNWNKESKETFAVSLDAIRLKDITSTSTRLEYLGREKTIMELLLPSFHLPTNSVL